MSDNTLSIDGYEGEAYEQIDISGTLTTNKKIIRQRILNQLPWIEKYRPSCIDDVILDEGTLQKIKKFITKKEMPNIIITGVPGIGKTTTIKCIASGIYGKYIKHAVIELNASDERGIKMVDENITNFCKKSFKLKMDDIVDNETEQKYAKHKLIILDEADNITAKAQHSINKKMEEYNSTTRFAFTCNKSSDILESIQSRCVIIRYVRLSIQKVIDRLKYICEIEKIKFTLEALNAIAIISQGDLRGAVNKLQAVYNGMNEITTENVFIVCDEPQPVVIQNVLKSCKEKNIEKTFERMSQLKLAGYSNSDIVLGIINVLKLDYPFSEQEKNLIFSKACKTAFYVSKGINTDLQLYGLIGGIINAYNQCPQYNIR